MAGSKSKKVLIIGSTANFMVMLMKFIAGGFTGSAAMLAEAFHSTADTMNQVLLFIGIKRSERKPDSRHQFGYGKERYFFSFIVAISIFAVGGVFSVYEGINKILHPHELENIIWAYAVLVGAIVFEGIALIFASRELKHIQAKAQKNLWRTIRDAKDTTIITVVFEDSAALIGLMLALAGITLTTLTGNGIFDGIASVAIGILLILIAIFLSVEVHSLLIGEAMTPENQQRVRSLIKDTPGVQEIITFHSLYMGPEDALIAVEIQFDERIDVKRLVSTIDQLEHQIQQAFPQVKKIFIEADNLKAPLKSD
jgi:cation diffusion facilitator family transporter